MKLLLVVAALAVVLAAAHVRQRPARAHADHREYPRHVLLRNELIDTTVDPEFHAHPDHLEYSSRFSTDTPMQWLVHVSAPAHDSKRRAIEAHVGKPLGRYVSHNSFLLAGTREDAHAARLAPHVLWVGGVLPRHKHDAELTSRAAPPAHRYNHTGLVVRFHSLSEDGKAVAAEMRARAARSDVDAVRGARFGGYGKSMIDVAVAHHSHIADVSAWLADHPESVRIERQSSFVPATATGYASASVMGGSGTTRPMGYNTLNIDGSPPVGTSTIAIQDFGLAESSCYWDAARSSQTSIPSQSDASLEAHGTAVFGACCGASPTPNDEFNGVATGVKVHINKVADSAPFTLSNSAETDMTEWANAASEGANVMLNAWGDDAADAEYSLISDGLDAFVTGDRNILVVQAAGNNGLAGSYTLGGAGVAKNVLTVGASLGCNEAGGAQKCQNLYENVAGADSTDFETAPGTTYFDASVVWTQSSRGPAADTRVKPDIVAPGAGVYTATPNGCASNNSHGQLDVAVSGTSLSAGFAAGAAALVRDYMLTQSAAAVSASLIKAVIINSGLPMRGVDAGTYNQASPIGKAFGWRDLNGDEFAKGFGGWGRVSLDKSLFFDNSPSPPSPNCDWTTINRGRVLATRADNQFVEEGGTYTACFRGSATGTVKATLVWSDPAPGEFNAFNLVNDLDLSVTDASTGRMWRGNGATFFDTVNNVEQVSLPVTNGTLYYFSVYGARIASAFPGLGDGSQSGQPFSLVASGDVSIIAPGQADIGTGQCPLLGSDTAYACGGDQANDMCPNNCGGKQNNVCNYPELQCSCGNSTNATSIDCSGLRCPNDCVLDTTRRGQCDYTSGACLCAEGFESADCSRNMQVLVGECDGGGASTGVIVGVAIGCLILGIIIGAVIGWFVAVKSLENQRKKRREQLMRGQGGQ